MQPILPLSLCACVWGTGGATDGARLLPPSRNLSAAAWILPPVWVQKSPDSLSQCFSRSELQPQVRAHRQAGQRASASLCDLYVCCTDKHTSIIASYQSSDHLTNYNLKCEGWFESVCTVIVHHRLQDQNWEIHHYCHNRSGLTFFSNSIRVSEALVIQFYGLLKELREL